MMPCIKVATRVAIAGPDSLISKNSPTFKIIFATNVPIEEKRIVYKYKEHNLEETKNMSKVQPKKEKNNDNSDKNINIALKILGVVCVFIVIIGLAFILIFSSSGKKEVKVPSDLIGLSEKEACKK